MTKTHRPWKEGKKAVSWRITTRERLRILRSKTINSSLDKLFKTIGFREKWA